MTPRAAAFRTVRVAANKLRDAVTEASDAMEAAERAGVTREAIIDALRLDSEDWDSLIRRYQDAHDLLSAVGARTRLDMMILVDDPIATEEQIVNYHIDQGFLAHHIGVSINDNPYSPEDAAATSWRQGWLTAKDGVSGD